MDYVQEFVSLYLDSENTASSYRIAIKQYRNWCQENFDWSMDDLVEKSTKREARLYLTYLENNTDLSPYSVNVKHSALDSFFKYLCDLDYRETNPFSNIRKANTKMVEQKCSYVTYEEYQLLLEATKVKTPRAKNFEFTSHRDYFMIKLMFTCGLRISEVFDLRFKDIDWERRVIVVIGKGNKRREIPLSLNLIEAYNEYMTQRGTCAENDFVFVSYTGNQMNRKDGNKNLKKYCERVGIDKDITNHSLRHGCVSYYIGHDVPIAKVSALVGHSNPQTTLTKYTHLTGEDLNFVDML